MIELIWVIVILGILAAVAIPKLAATRDDAHIAQGRADVLTIRSGIINERQARMFRGDTSYTATLGGTDPLFGTVVQGGIRPSSGSGGWTRTDDTHYDFHLNATALTFEYNTTTGNFFCDTTGGTAQENSLCLNLTR
jgi:general secretion pathway protein G